MDSSWKATSDSTEILTGGMGVKKNLGFGTRGSESLVYLLWGGQTSTDNNARDDRRLQVMVRKTVRDVQGRGKRGQCYQKLD